MVDAKTGDMKLGIFQIKSLKKMKSKQTVKFVIAQPKITSEEYKTSDAYKEYVESILRHANDIDLLVFPEYSIPLTLHPIFETWTSQNECIVVAGTDFSTNSGNTFNQVALFHNGKVLTRSKNYLSPHEIEIDITEGNGAYLIFEDTPIGTLCIFICHEIDKTNPESVLESLANFRSECEKPFSPDVLCVIACQDDASLHHNILRHEVDRYNTRKDKGVYVIYNNLFSPDNAISNGRSAFFSAEHNSNYQQGKVKGLISESMYLSQAQSHCMVEMIDDAGYLFVEAVMDDKFAIAGDRETQRNVILRRSINKYLGNGKFSECTWMDNPLKAKHNLPQRNENFIGREEYLKRLKASFHNKRNGRITTQIIRGLGGVGKTQLGLEYAFQNLENYSYICWLNATDQSSFISSARDFFAKLGFSVDVEDNKNALRNWLNSHENWLLILDNVENESDIDNYCSSFSSRGDILISSRKPLDYGDEVLLEIFSSEEAVSFLIRRTNIDDANNARKIANRLGYLPLALEQTAAFIRQKAENYEGYIRRLEKHGLHLLDATKPRDYNLVVTTTWLITFDELSIAAQHLLYLCAYYSPECIPVYYIEPHSQILPQELSGADYDELTDELIHYSLVSRVISGISIHKLVQEVIRDYLMRNGNVDYIWYSFNIAFATIPYKAEENTDNINIVRRFANHAFAAAKHFIDSDEIDELGRPILLLINLNKNYAVAGMYLAAQHAIALAIDSIVVQDSVDSTLLLLAKARLAESFFKLREFYRAKEIYEVIIPELECQMEEPNSAFMFQIYHGAAMLYSELESFNKAHYYVDKASSCIDKIDDKSATVSLISALADISFQRGDYATALGLFNSCLKKQMNSLNANTINIARTRLNIATLNCELCDYPKALEEFNNAIPVFKKYLGEFHFETAQAISVYARILRDQGHLDEAIDQFEKVIAIYEKASDAKHAVTVNMRVHLAITVLRKQEYQPAYSSLIELLPKMKKIYGDHHIEIAQIYSNIAIAAYALNNSDEALEYAIAAAPIFSDVYGDNHLDAVSNLIVMARIYYEKENYTESYRIYKNALPSLLKLLTEVPPLISDFCNVADLYARNGVYKEALKYYEKALHFSEVIYERGCEVTKKIEQNIEFITARIGCIGRNDLCPCGSGKKYKKCHGR